MHSKNIITAGKNIEDAKKIMVLLHGRGSNARDILSLAGPLGIDDYSLFAPQATNNTWYPHSFLVPPDQNEPWLSSALQNLEELLSDIKSKGFATENLYFAGFSQGACLTAEFVTRNADKFGGMLLFTGGLIGDKVYAENYRGNFNGMPVFIGTGNPDAHVPVERVEETAQILEKMQAKVTVKIYNNRPHSISDDEIRQAKKILR